MKTFNQLSTELFRRSMQPYALRIYDSVFPECTYSRELDINKDKHFSIDATIITYKGQKITIQEKFRKSKFLTDFRLQEEPPFPDFTQEYMNAHGTEFQTEGEYFKLYSHLYFYGWANKEKAGFKKWILMDVLKYKQLLEENGIEKIGSLKRNNRHGKASFYAIPFYKLEKAIIKSNINWERVKNHLMEKEQRTWGFIEQAS